MARAQTTSEAGSGLVRAVVDAYRAVRRWLLLTDLGFLVLGLGVLALRGFGLPRGDFVVQVAGAGAIAIVALGLASVLLGTVVVASRAWAPSSEVLAFEAVRGFFDGEAWPRVYWPLVDIRIQVRAPIGLVVGSTDGRERFEAGHRTAAAELERDILIEDAFGLVRAELRRRESRAVEVSPWLGQLDRAPALSALTLGATHGHPRGQPAGDRVEMRPYVPGDPLRLVLWKVYARTGQLVVRTPERALDDDVEVHGYLVSGPGDEPSAAAAWVAISRGSLGPRWRFGADGTAEDTDDEAAAHTAIAASRRAPEGEGVARFMAHPSRGAGVHVVFFVPCRPGRWLDAVQDAVRSRAGRVTVIVAHDGLSEPAIRSWMRSVPLEVEARLARPEPDALERVHRSLRGAGAHVVVVDRPSGVGHTDREAWRGAA